jgi:zinc transporter, ZIP family
VAAAALWGLVAGAALLVGAAAGFYTKLSKLLVGLVMGFGAGVLISALAFDLTREAFTRGGADAAAIGLFAGGLTFFGGDWWIDHRGGEHRKRSGDQQAAGSPGAIVLGALLDGIPESAAIGVSLVEGHGVGLAFVAAVFLSNVPEAASASTGMRQARRSPRYVFGLWLGVVAVSTLAAAIGYAALGGASDEVVGIVQAFAAGAILVMLADTMMPEAFESSGAFVGLVTLAGFTTAFVLSTID